MFWAAVLKALKFARGNHVSLTVNAVIFWREPAAATNRETDFIKSGPGGFFSNRIERIEEREERKSLLLLFLVFILDCLVFTIVAIKPPSVEAGTNLTFWGFSNEGNFTVKSTYQQHFKQLM